MSDSLLSANGLTLAFGHQRLLDGVTLAVAAGEKVGLVGRNGSGKTSLLKLLAGATPPDSGEITRRRGLRIGYLPQEFELDDTKTARQNIEAGAADLLEWLRRYESGEGSEAELGDLLHKIEHADGWNLQARINAEAAALDVPPLNAPVAPLSGGEKRRIALCRALVSQPDLLLLDEPTNHLDADSIRWLEEFLRGFPGAVIFVTHDRYFLDVIATRIIELADGRAFSHPGNYTAYLEAKAVRQQIAEQTERRRQRFLRVELDWVRAGVRAQRSKARFRLDTFYDVAGLEAPPEEREMDLIIPPAPELGNTVVELENAGASLRGSRGHETPSVSRDNLATTGGTHLPHNSPDLSAIASDATAERREGPGMRGDVANNLPSSPATRWLFRHLKLTLKPGQCTGIVGRNGVGKTTLLRICMGERPPDEGTVKIGRQVKFNYVDQARMQLDETKTVLEQVTDGGETVLFGEERLSARGYLRRFLFPDERANEPINKLSGGERARLMLAKVLKRGGNVLVLDEPTNDLDLPSLRMLEEAIVHFQGTVLVVSHDRYFLDRICDQIIAFEDDAIFIQPGNYSYYLEKKQQRDASRAALNPSPQKPAAAEPAAAPKSARPRKLSYKEMRELEGMESAILDAETGVHKLEAALNDPAFYATRAAEAPQVIADLDAARAEVARLYARWAELESIPKS